MLPFFRFFFFFFLEKIKNCLSADFVRSSSFIHWSALKHKYSISFWSWPQMLLYATCKWLILSKYMYIPSPHKNSPYLNGRVKCQKVHIRKAASKTDQQITAVRGRGMERMSQPIFTSRSTYRVRSVSTIMMSPHKMSRSKDSWWETSHTSGQIFFFQNCKTKSRVERKHGYSHKSQQPVTTEWLQFDLQHCFVSFHIRTNREGMQALLSALNPENC